MEAREKIQKAHENSSRKKLIENTCGKSSKKTLPKKHHPTMVSQKKLQKKTQPKMMKKNPNTVAKMKSNVEQTPVDTTPADTTPVGTEGGGGGNLLNQLETDAGIDTHAGPEIGVASTKAFTAQVTVLTMIALKLGRRRGVAKDLGQNLIKALNQVDDNVRRILDDFDSIISKDTKDS